MTSALIGYTGFVGSNLDRQYTFTDKYNTSNINELDGRTYDLVVSAANRAEMWRINQEPEKDLAEINEFIGHLKTVQIKKLVLISSVGVYKNPVGVNEDTQIETDGLLPYGVNRYYLENFCRDNFEVLIVRLPGLFGPGLKKNVIFDLLHDNNVERIHHKATYQYYNLENIWQNIQTALDNNLQLVNFAVEPLSTDELAKACFGIDFTNEPEGVKPAFFDMRTKYAELFGGSGNYIYSKQQEIADIKAFVHGEREKL
jgi:nucleoside-diphosphate-sugar epimerase